MKQFILIFLIISSLLFGQSAFETDSWDIKTEESNGSAIEWSGFYEFEPRLFLNNNDFDYEIQQSLDLTLNVTNDKVALKATVNLDDRDDTEFIEELVASLYLGRLQIDAGRQRIVWGKGDMLHIVDNMNADDYYDFIFPDYLQRRRAEDMLHVNLVVGPYQWNSQIEFAYAPSFTPFQFPRTGPWKPSYLNVLENLEPTFDQLGISIVEEEFNALKDRQYAARWNQSLGPVDFGISYYNGRLRLPAFQMTDFLLTESGAIPQTFKIVNNPLEVYGFEFTTAIRGLNLRAEAAYYKTDDPDGIHYDVLNPKWSILLGGDINLPVHNVNLNVQYLKDFVTDEDPIFVAEHQALMTAMITGLGLDPSLANMDLSNYYENNILSVRFGDSFFRETLRPEIQYAYRIDNKDSMMSLLLDFEVSEGFHMIGTYRVFTGDPETVFGQYDNNDFISLRLEYQF